jgi:transposase-like protein
MERVRSPRTLWEFEAMFPDEEACWEHLRRVRWPRGFRCPRCGHAESYPIRDRGLEQCRACRHQASLTAGTVLHRTRVPLRTWFLAIFFLGRHKKGISALQFQKDAGIGSYKTAWALFHKVRSALAERPARRLVGLVEADETYVGRRGERGVTGRQTRRKAIVAAAVENRGPHAGALRLAVVPGVSQADLGPFVRAMIDASEAVVRTDDWSGYFDLAAHGATHQRLRQGDPRRAARILPWSHTVFSNLKTWLRGTFHGVSNKHLPRYLQEFEYRFNRRWRESQMFEFVLRRAVLGEPCPVHRLVAE